MSNKLTPEVLDELEKETNRVRRKFIHGTLERKTLELADLVISLGREKIELQKKAEEYREALQEMVDQFCVHKEYYADNQYYLRYGDNGIASKKAFALLGIKDGQPYEKKGE